jgi:hypothetical protein
MGIWDALPTAAKAPKGPASGALASFAIIVFVFGLCLVSSAEAQKWLQSSSPSAKRNPLQQPFASMSIWNMPIGSGAVFAPANLSANPDPSGAIGRTPVSQPEEERIVLTPTAPLTTIYYSNAAWTDADRCSPSNTGSVYGFPKRIPMPSGFVVTSDGKNDGAAFLMPDGRTIVQMQPLARCTTGGSGTALVAHSNWTVDLYGDGIAGAHGGSGLSTIGGTIRLGELRPGQLGMHHALKIDVYSALELYHGATRADDYRWPASTADSCTPRCYGSVPGPNNNNPAMKMGALLAIPSSLNINSLGLETEAALQLAWTLQNYGAYIVDSNPAPDFYFAVEEGAQGSFQAQFQADWGFPFYEYVMNNTPWVRDIMRIRPVLQVVNNNSPTSIGGGGTPLQPLAPPIGP